MSNPRRNPMTNIRDLLFRLTIANLCGVDADMSAKNQVTRYDRLRFHRQDDRPYPRRDSL
jgi:hypothetical protein